MTVQQRKLKALISALEEIDRVTANGTVVYTPELDSAMAMLRQEIEELEEACSTS